MAGYVRKTKDEYILLGNWGYGWDEVLAEDSYKEIKTRLKEYRENDKTAVFKTAKRRIKIKED